jgi:phytanoyl-CoA hydroxylase
MSFETDAKPVSFQSRFGGLWTDLTNADEILAGKLALGTITAIEAEMLNFWIKNGYVIIDNAVSVDVIDAARKAIAAVYEQSRALVETYEFGDVRYARVESRHRTMPHKLIDAYAHSKDIQRMILSDRIVRFLNIIFDRPALAFQGLYFESGSQQDIHQDTAYVRVNRPMELAASWLAMEDIQEGSGELEYYVGSHRIPEFLFDGKAKWMPLDSTEHPQFLAHLKAESERLGLKKERFRPKKGDALIWSADLCHGGSPVTNKTTRQSFVTHWCPATADPFYFNTPHHTGKVKVNERAYFSYGFHGSPTDPYK